MRRYSRSVGNRLFLGSVRPRRPGQPFQKVARFAAYLLEWVLGPPGRQDPKNPRFPVGPKPCTKLSVICQTSVSNCLFLLLRFGRPWGALHRGPPPGPGEVRGRRIRSKTIGFVLLPPHPQPLVSCGNRKYCAPFRYVQVFQGRIELAAKAWALLGALVRHYAAAHQNWHLL